VRVSDDTVWRAVKHWAYHEDADPVRHIGVDDWAWRKGQRYGTILVDLERHKVLDVLPDRSADDVAVWLHAHPTIKTINRDRCGTYADGAARGAPDAVQIAYRFHLVLNLSAVIERALEEPRRDLQLCPTEPNLSADLHSGDQSQDKVTAEKRWSGRGLINCAIGRRGLLQRDVSAILVIVREIFTPKPSEIVLVQRVDVIGQFPASTANPTVPRLRSATGFVHSFGSD
jgi:hypothetical protein